MGYGNGAGLSPRYWGETGGEFAVTLLQTQLPSHSHGVACISGAGTLDSPNVPANTVWASDGTQRVPPPLYAAAVTNVSMNAAAVQNKGGNVPHNNMLPYLAVYFIIALQGIYPPRS